MGYANQRTNEFTLILKNLGGDNVSPREARFRITLNVSKPMVQFSKLSMINLMTLSYLFRVGAIGQVQELTREKMRICKVMPEFGSRSLTIHKRINALAICSLSRQ